jgi:glycosyltransferase involved in cell wall biosynthesis
MVPGKDTKENHLGIAGEPKILLSVCIPAYNEEGNIIPIYERIKSVMAPLASRYDFELLFTDNHSEDRTFEEIAELARRDPRVRALRFSRNFGFQQSILTNFCNARGEAAIQLDCDMQDPPELIPKFLELWSQGYKVVYGIRRARPKESKRLFYARKVFYRLIDVLSEDRLPPDAGDFRLIDRCILEQLRLVRDQSPYLRGMIATMGFRQIGIPYDRNEREKGATKFNFSRLTGLAIDGILQHSIVPLRLATILGAIMSLVAAISAIYYLVVKLFFPVNWPPGFASLNILLLFSIGANSLFLGILGEYVGRIHKNAVQRPGVIVEKVIDPIGPDFEAHK